MGYEAIGAKSSCKPLKTENNFLLRPLLLNFTFRKRRLGRHTSYN